MRLLDRLAGPARGRHGSPILVTGIPRAGTSWVGHVLDASGRVVYVNEPLNPEHPPGRSPGVMGARVAHRYQYIGEHNEHEFLRAYRDTTQLRYHPLRELRLNHSPADLARVLKYWSSFARGRVRGRRTLLDDPYAVVSAAWFRRRLGCDVVVLVRHPAAIVHSWAKLGWADDLGELLSQPALMARLEPLRDEIERATARRVDSVERVSVLWKAIYFIVAELRRADPGSVFRYEDLAREPRAAFERLCGAVHLPFDDRVSRAVDEATTGSAEPRTSHRWQLSWRRVARTAYTRLDSRAYAYRWRDEVDADIVRRVRALTEPVAGEFYGTDEW